MLNIFCPYRGRKQFYDDFIYHYHIMYPSARIYMLEQDDTKLFKRGQLMNVAFDYLNKQAVEINNILFVDVDLRLKYKIPFEAMIKQYDSVIIPYHYLGLCNFIKIGEYEVLQQPSYFLSPPDGGATLFTKEQFEKCNGFSNLYIGWGKDDSDFLRRNIQVTKIKNEMYHLEHKRNGEWNQEFFKRNDENFKMQADYRLDGYKQTTYSCIMTPINESVFHCSIKNIGVVPDYIYKKYLFEMNDE